MRFTLTFVCLISLASVGFSQEESPAEQMKKIREDHKSIMATQNMMLSTITAQKARSDSQDDAIAILKAEVAAIKAASGVKTVAVQNWAGDPQFTTQPQAVNWSQPQMMTGAVYGQMQMQQRTGLFGGGLFKGKRGAGGCAGGSCGVN